ncbi:hypothetical protein Tco_1202591 [Tanacetum coccineum]
MYEKFPMITNIAFQELDVEIAEKIVWRDRNGKDLKFSVNIAYSDMSIQYPVVPWISLEDGRDYAVNRCSLCCQESKDINHLLFQCPFSRELWIKVRRIANIEYNTFDLMNIIQFLINARNGNNIRSVIRLTAFSASIYNIWKERNGRIFRDVKRSCDEVFNNIVDKVKQRMLGLTVKDSSVVRDIEKKWAITYKRINHKKSH